MLFKDFAEKRKREYAARKEYYMLLGLSNFREKREQIETRTMQMVQRVKFGATNYSD